MTKLKVTERTVTKTINARVFEVPLLEVLKMGSINYSDSDDLLGVNLAVGEDCMDTFVGVFVKGKLVPTEDVMIAIAEEMEGV